MLPDGDPADPFAFSGITSFLTAALTECCRGVGIDLIILQAPRFPATESLIRTGLRRKTFVESAATLIDHHQRVAVHMATIVAGCWQPGDVVVSMNPLHPFLGALRAPIVYYVDCSLVNFYLHPVHGTVPRQYRSPTIRRTLRNLEGTALRNAAYVCCFSSAARREICETYRLPGQKVRVIGAGVNVDFPAYRRRQRRPVTRLLFVGRDFARKGGPQALDAVRRLSTRDWQLTCVTGANEADHHRNVPPNVRVIGPQSRTKIARLMHEADIFIAPSAVEPYGMAIAEAMAHSLPVVASSCFAIPEILGFDNPGLLHNATPAAQASIIRRLTDDRDLYDRMALANYLRAFTSFRWQDVAMRLITCALDADGGASH